MLHLSKKVRSTATHRLKFHQMAALRLQIKLVRTQSCGHRCRLVPLLEFLRSIFCFKKRIVVMNIQLKKQHLAISKH